MKIARSLLSLNQSCWPAPAKSLFFDSVGQTRKLTDPGRRSTLLHKPARSSPIENKRDGCIGSFSLSSGKRRCARLVTQRRNEKVTNDAAIRRSPGLPCERNRTASASGHCTARGDAMASQQAHGEQQIFARRRSLFEILAARGGRPSKASGEIEAQCRPSHGSCRDSPHGAASARGFSRGAHRHALP